ncbi:hypothetical protein [Agromyces sp. GXQ0307]|uniref:hypothetical protein n=1 Tax=Agromyces sp. GXQ0307 TaxID=3377835 RepID=UPI00383B347E
MNVWLFLYGVVLLGLGAFILLNKERMLRFAQKHLRRNVGQLGRDVADAGKPGAMTGPGIGVVAIGVIVLVEAFRVA